jgi:hypothetical protein
MHEGGNAQKLHVLLAGQIYFLALALDLFGQDEGRENQA